ncbi:MAG: hypothetical protein ACI4F5_08095 [Acutalibacteraceae bacterium]
MPLFFNGVRKIFCIKNAKGLSHSASEGVFLTLSRKAPNVTVPWVKTVIAHILMHTVGTPYMLLRLQAGSSSGR